MTWHIFNFFVPTHRDGNNKQSGKKAHKEMMLHLSFDQSIVGSSILLTTNIRFVITNTGWFNWFDTCSSYARSRVQVLWMEKIYNGRALPLITLIIARLQWNQGYKTQTKEKKIYAWWQPRSLQAWRVLDAVHLSQIRFHTLLSDHIRPTCMFMYMCK